MVMERDESTPRGPGTSRLSVNKPGPYKGMGRNLALVAALLFGIRVYAQPELPLSVPPDSARWDLQGNAKPAEYQGRKCLLIDGGAAVVKDYEMRDGVIDVDVATPAVRGFFGFDVRVPEDGSN